MNKLFMCAAITGAAFSISAVSVFAAANPQVTVTVNNREYDLPYNVASGVTAELPLDSSVFSIASTNDTEEYTEKEFSVSSTRDSLNTVDLKLVFTSETDNEYSALDYYDIKLADSEGNYIYDCESDMPTSDIRNEIDLGTFNSQFSNETKSYTLYYKINPEAAELMEKPNASDLQISIEATEVISGGAGVTGGVITTQSPTVQPASAEPAATQDAATEAPAEPTATADAELSEKTYVCGEDLDPGRYVVEGNADITIKDKDGKVLRQFIVTDGSLGDFDGVKRAVVTISDGDTITVKSLVPDQKAKVTFTSSDASSTAKPSSSTSSNNRSNNSTSSKTTNPKTGDNSIAIPAIITVMGLSAGFVAVLEVLKRRSLSK